MEANDRLAHYELNTGRMYHYLRVRPDDSNSTYDTAVRENPKGNVEKFQELEQQLLDLGFQENQLETLYCMIAAILNLGEIQFKQEQDNEVEIVDPEAAAKGDNPFFEACMCRM
jgi:myosin heavy subunit